MLWEVVLGGGGQIQVQGELVDSVRAPPPSSAVVYLDRQKIK